jgi:hypothetical protein
MALIPASDVYTDDNDVKKTLRGAENAGFINCCAPQTFLHGFVIK